MKEKKNVKQKSHIVETASKYHRRFIERAKLDTLTYKFITADFHGLVQAIQ
jgi:hypothetical protein